MVTEDDRNEVVIVGRLSGPPMARELPSGDVVTSFRVVVRRPENARRGANSPVVDALECAAWRGDVRRVVRGWAPGDLVQVAGSLRRRFWRSASGAASTWEIEVAKARRMQRA